ncbi:MAG TPA: tetratricopeptide repeat protein [Thermoanaerobaculia bacterium]|nr:tetratricopeptide repeat protein [Thermoanaerobaculia bacterium]
MAVAREKVIQAAERLVSRGKVDAAIREYRKVLADNPRDTNTLNRVGDLYARLERIEDAVGLFTRIAEQYTEDGFFVKAIAIYKKIIKLDPTRLEIYERLAELYHRQGLVNEARTQYQVLIDYYQKHRQPEQAIAICQRMLVLEPTNPSHRARIADLLEQEGRIPEAISEYRRIAEQMLGAGQIEGAVRVYDKAVEIASDDLLLVEEAVEQLRRAGAESAAAKLLATASRRNPAAGALARAPREAPAPPVQPPASPVEEATASTDEVLGWAKEPALDETGTSWRSGPLGKAELFVEEVELPAELTEVGGEVFTLDLDSDDEPASLVKPPPDLVAPPAFVAEALAAADLELEVPLELPPFGDETVRTSAPFAPAEDFEEAVDLYIDEEALEKTAAELEPRRQDHEDDLVAEAEVLAKYGLRTRALERLDEVFRGNPRHLGAYSLQIQLHLEEGRYDRVTILANEMASIAADTGRAEDWLPTRERLLAAGFEMQGARKVLAPAAAPMEAGGAAHEVGSSLAEIGELDLHVDLELPADLDLAGELEGPATPGPAVADAIAREAEPPAPVPRLAAEAWLELEIEELDLPVPSLEIELEATPELAEPVAQVAEPAAEAVAPALTPFEAEGESWALPEERPVAPPRAARKNLDLDLDATMAQISAVLEDTRSGRKPRRKPASEPVAAAPPPAPAAAEPAAELRLEPPEVETPAPAALDPPAAAAAPAPPAPVLKVPLFTEEDLADFEVYDLGPMPAAKPARPPKAAAPPPPAAKKPAPPNWLDEVGSEAASPVSEADQLFDDEQEFFDLAAELEQELRKEEEQRGDEGVFGSPHEQTLEEIVEGFKRGVAEHLSPEDFETHFNLGIAYREMGLLDEAIGEFQLAAKDSGKLVDCCSLLGMCFLEKGLPGLAIKWYRRGLDRPGLTEDESLSLLYDLGNAYAIAGDNDNAYKTFVDIYGTNSHYRDVVARLEELAP